MLNQILEVKREEIQKLYDRKQQLNLSFEQKDIPRYPFLQRLRSPRRSSALIAEVKKASPSKGVIRPDFHPVEIARAYQAAGVDALSVLTDVPFFQGHPDYIRLIKEQVSLPVLRKDFILDPLQVWESAALGADAILLIAKALPSSTLVKLYREAEHAGLDCLIEVASREELEEVLEHLHPPIIGINNRDLTTFTTDPERTKSLLPFIPPDILVISESGINCPEMVQDLEKHGVGGFLIGEHFMRQDDIESAVRRLYGEA
ncbi:Indole-3-glycerol phosphate synthase [Caldalkalibacillus thermarum TA2.A1]|uniref:Indole-3-glycerol phosphate synthase n=1 Tax=Caldalkalibacillus thermarum (strain TA2.A1) TaxID=986075 RepID=F5L730_CALTT|nr:indole-3-glycerol phosphate synthase TrpC [Caldalkalibacillus thermarum]EGL82865.1 Indole-3-glycerol phosphate synthase [Caldalkalibacillus thermarum TA2.A1]QZT32718.1 indole-3-glycerol phosphate synthase TrpC [Caldalkalibacillus thermarum TA2.A1]GGK24855.1 indole-3-glycerol phosphate synthase [Caldalkalibacillus thermarum]